MKEIRNKSIEPISIPLPGGKVLRLGPGNVAQIGDSALSREAVQELIKAGTIEILNASARTGYREGGESSGQSRGPSKSPFRGRRGDR